MKYNFEDLELWQVGMKVVHETYRVAEKFFANGHSDIGNKIRDAAISVPLNIARGSSRITKKEFRNSIKNSISSVLEIITYLRVAQQENFISAEELGHLESALTEVESLLEKTYFKLTTLESKI